MREREKRQRERERDRQTERERERERDGNTQNLVATPLERMLPTFLNGAQAGIKQCWGEKIRVGAY